ncbi:ABC transporter substrate-binding protein [Halocola ammonii]
MTTKSNLLLFFVVGFLLFSCTENADSNEIENPDAAGLKTIRPEIAEGFYFQNHGSYEELVLLDLTGDTTEQRWILFPKDGELPDSLKDERVLRTPLQNIACLSTTHTSMIAKLNALDQIGGMAYADYVLNPEVKTHLEQEKIKSLSGANGIDQEQLIALDPDAFFIYPYERMNTEKLESAGIPCVDIAEYQEGHPLGRAEWLKVFGKLLGKEQEADSVFLAIKKRYESLKSKVASSSTIPSVFTGSYSNGNWYAPTGDSFIAVFLRDAGANYIFREAEGRDNLTLDFETLYNKAYETDFWGKVVHEEGDLTLEKVRENDPRLTTIKAFEEKQIFYCNTAEADYFGDGVVEPELILEDLIAIFHPNYVEDHIPKYFQLIEE